MALCAISMGRKKGRDYTTKKYTAVYDKEHKQLVDNFKGVVFTFVPDKGLLLMGSAGVPQGRIINNL